MTVFLYLWIHESSDSCISGFTGPQILVYLHPQIYGYLDTDTGISISKVDLVSTRHHCRDTMINGCLDVKIPGSEDM